MQRGKSVVLQEDAYRRLQQVKGFMSAVSGETCTASEAVGRAIDLAFGKGPLVAAEAMKVLQAGEK